LFTVLMIAAAPEPDEEFDPAAELELDEEFDVWASLGVAAIRATKIALNANP